jgi:hypothetical protein
LLRNFEQRESLSVQRHHEIVLALLPELSGGNRNPYRV